eukprot:contig_27485_g6761
MARRCQRFLLRATSGAAEKCGFRGTPRHGNNINKNQRNVALQRDPSGTTWTVGAAGMGVASAPWLSDQPRKKPSADASARVAPTKGRPPACASATPPAVVCLTWTPQRRRATCLDDPNLGRHVQGVRILWQPHVRLLLSVGADERVDPLDRDLVHGLDGIHNLGLVGPHVHNEHNRVVVLNLLHRRLGGQGELDDGQVVHARLLRDRLTGVLGVPSQLQGLGPVELHRRADLPDLLGGRALHGTSRLGGLLHRTGRLAIYRGRTQAGDEDKTPEQGARSHKQKKVRYKRNKSTIQPPRHAHQAPQGKEENRAEVSQTYHVP